MRRTKTVNGKERQFGNYQFVLRVNGDKRWFNTGTSDLDAARLKKAEVLLKLNSGAGERPDNRITVIQYTDRWLEDKEARAAARHTTKDSTLKKYRAMTASFKTFFVEHGLEHLEMRNLTATHANDFLTWRVRQGRFNGKSKVLISEQGANKQWRNLHMIVHQAVRDGILARDFKDEVELFRVPKKRVCLPALAEIEEVLAYVEELGARAVILGTAVLGTRPSELFNLIWDHVDFRSSPPRLLIHPLPGEPTTPKNESSIREVAIHKDLLPILRQWRHERPDAKGEDRVFRMPDNRPMADYVNYSYRRLQKAIKAANRARKKNGQEEIPRFTLRLLRHWNASWSINRSENPLPTMAVAKNLGHMDSKMLEEVYYHPDLEGTTGQRMHDAPFFTKDREAFARRASADGTEDDAQRTPLPTPTPATASQAASAPESLMPDMRSTATPPSASEDGPTEEEIEAGLHHFLTMDGLSFLNDEEIDRGMADIRSGKRSGHEVVNDLQPWIA